MRTRIKICGITRHEDLTCAVDAGADAVGFVFHSSSKRFVTAERAAELVRNLPAFVSSVALFVNPEPQFVHSVIQIMRPTLLQFHGEETPEFCASFEIPYIKAFRVGAPGMDSARSLKQSCQQFASARGWLFDSYTPAYGGSGHTFDHAMLSELLALESGQRAPIILSGGLNAQTLLTPVRQLRPWAVDVSSGVEESPGMKSPPLIAAFVSAVKKADE
ncbi:MAG: phosphoribosylanthranilate isomerase [Burkholderiaceae bacterium]|nr:phosphoribosylanthranilate isomerase [Burkholderiaceae bacterium]